MTDLDDRFRSFSRTKTPDLWREISLREPRTLPPPPPRRRALAIAVAFLIAAAGVAVVAITFGGSKAHRLAGEPGSAVTNGAIAYVSEGTAWLVQPDGSGAKKLMIDVPGFVGGLSWSPDGRRIVFDVNSYPKEGAPKGGFFDIYAANADGTDVVRLTHDRDARLPAWSPDGSRIAFTREDQAGSQIYVMNADGADSIALTDGSGFSVRPTWSPDGSRIAFESVADGNSDVYVMNADGGGVTSLTDDPAADYNPVWSPDGERIAFASDRSPSGIYVMRTDGSDVRLVEPDGDIANLGLAWSPNGRFLAFSSSRGEGFARAVYVLDVSSNAITQISGRGAIWGPSWQPIIATSATPSIEPLPPSSAEVVGTFQVGQDVRSVAYGEGSVWVAVSNNDGTFGGRILRIDPTTHNLEAAIVVDVIPTWEVGGGAMVFADGDLWVAGDLEMPGAFDDPGGGADAAVIRIDASTNEVVQTIALGGSGAADLTFLDGELWVLVFGDETVDHRMEVVRVDRAPGDVEMRIRLEADWGHTIVAAEGRLVVLEAGKGGVNVDGVAAAIDPATNAVMRGEIPSETFIPMPVVWRGQVWVGLDPGFAGFDPVLGAFADPPVALDPNDVGCCGFLEADDRGIWFLSPDPGGGSGSRLIVFDPVTGETTRLVDVDEGRPVAMAVVPNAVWILNYEGTLTHVELG
jgi:TolB protein